MMSRMSAVELAEQVALEEFDPLPDPWWIGAKICSVLINVNRAKGSKPVMPEDVMPFLRGPRKKQTPAQMARAIAEWLD